MAKYVLREGKSIPVDEVFEAWTSGNIERMIKAANIKTNNIDRHYLLLGIVEKTYKLRNEHDCYRNICKEFSEKHIHEFHKIYPSLKNNNYGVMPNVPTFKWYITILVEDGCYEKAISICKTALTFGLGDGTKTGYEGRINRIEKMRT